jgi:hypothetical protein
MSLGITTNAESCLESMNHSMDVQEETDDTEIEHKA